MSHRVQSIGPPSTQTSSIAGYTSFHSVPNELLIVFIIGQMLSFDGLSSHIKTLTLHNLPSRYDPSTEKEGFDMFLGQLLTLQLII